LNIVKHVYDDNEQGYHASSQIIFKFRPDMKKFQVEKNVNYLIKMVDVVSSMAAYTVEYSTEFL